MNEALDDWFKPISMLQNNRALIGAEANGAVTIKFINDAIHSAGKFWKSSC